MLAIFVVAQPTPELVERADSAGEKYIACLFAQSRAAHAAGLSAAEFKRRLGSFCTVEERRARDSMEAVLARRGDANASAKARKLGAEARAGVVATYEKMERMAPELEKWAEICRQQPEACR